MHTDEFIRLLQGGATLKSMVCHPREYLLDDGEHCYRLTQPMIDALIRQGVLERGPGGRHRLAKRSTKP